MSQRRPISQGGSEPCLCGGTASYALSWAWATALWPEVGILRPYPLGMGVGNSPLLPLSCQLEEIGSGEFIGLRGVPWIFLTFNGSWHPGKGHPLTCCASGQVLTGTCHPFGCLESKATSRRRDGELVPISSIFSAMPRE